MFTFFSLRWYLRLIYRWLFHLRPLRCVFNGEQIVSNSAQSLLPFGDWTIKSGKHLTRSQLVNAWPDSIPDAWQLHTIRFVCRYQVVVEERGGATMTTTLTLSTWPTKQFACSHLVFIFIAALSASKRSSSIGVIFTCPLALSLSLCFLLFCTDHNKR
jgi:hypothetical protein